MNDECRIERPNFPFQIYSCTEFFVMCAVQWIYIRFFSHSFAFSANTMDLWWLWIQIMFSILRHDRWNNLNSLEPTRAREKKKQALKQRAGYILISTHKNTPKALRLNLPVHFHCYPHFPTYFSFFIHWLVLLSTAGKKNARENSKRKKRKKTHTERKPQ